MGPVKILFLLLITYIQRSNFGVKTVKTLLIYLSRFNSFTGNPKDINLKVNSLFTKIRFRKLTEYFFGILRFTRTIGQITDL